MGKSERGSYKYKTGDMIGVYEIIKPLPHEPNITNLRIWCICNLCGEKVVRYSNRLESKHRGCSSELVVKKGKVKKPKKRVRKSQKKPSIAPVPHTRKDGTPVYTDENGYTVDEDELEQEIQETTPDLAPEESEEFSLPDTMELPDEVKEALSVDINQQAIEIIKRADKLDSSTKFIFINTFKRYLTLVHVARRLEQKMNKADVELTIVGASGKQVANPLIVQYKQLSSESNATVKILLNMVSKMTAGDSDDPLLDALNGKRSN